MPPRAKKPSLAVLRQRCIELQVDVSDSASRADLEKAIADAESDRKEAAVKSGNKRKRALAPTPRDETLSEPELEPDNSLEILKDIVTGVLEKLDLLEQRLDARDAELKAPASDIDDDDDDEGLGKILRPLAKKRKTPILSVGQRIQRGEFFEVGAVLYALKHSTDLSAVFAKKAASHDESALVQVTKKGDHKTLPVSEFSDWCRAIGTMALELTKEDPVAAADLLKYQEVLARLHLSFKLSAILALDNEWRRSIADNGPPFKFSKVDSTLVALHTTAANARPSSSSSSASSVASAGPKQGKKASAAVRKGSVCKSCLAPNHPGVKCDPSRPKACWPWNYGGCNKPSCPRRHLCFLCGKDHKAMSCSSGDAVA
jgi:hypothetical protein